MSPPFILVNWPGGAPPALPSVRTGSVQQDDTGTSTAATRANTHILSEDAIAGDVVFFFVSTDGAFLSHTSDRGTTVLVDVVGGFRATGTLFRTTVTADDVTAGQIVQTFSAGATETWAVTSFEASGIDPVEVQESIDNTTSNRTSAAGLTLTGVGEDSLLIAACHITPDSGTVGITITNARSFTQLGGLVRLTPAAGGTQHYVGFRLAPSAGSYTGPDYASDASPANPGNTIHHGIWEYAA